MELELSEGRVSGARYYTVHPVPNWDLTGDWGDIDTWKNMTDWATAIFGPEPEDGVWTPGARWYTNNAKFWFREKKDLEWFVLKWK